MRLRRVRLQNVYSFRETQLSCDHAITAIIGPNDAGKTNIFRALDYVAGLSPSLAIDSEMTCQFSEEPPLLQFGFVVEPSEHSKLADILGDDQLSETSSHLTVLVKHDFLEVILAQRRWTFSGEKGVEVIGRMVETIFIRPQLDPLRGSRTIAELLADIESPEARLLALSGIDREDYRTIRNLGEDGLESLLRAGRTLTQLVRAEWRQDERITIELAPFGRSGSDRGIEIKIGDGSRAVVSLDRKGEGFGWFLALFAKLQQLSQREALCNLLLVDEPGVYLHPGGQTDLRSLLSKLATESRQIIYTTHSPFMLDWSRPHQVRLVHRQDSSESSIIVDKPYHTNAPKFTLWDPFRRSMGLLLGDFGMLGEKDLFVEGISDQVLYHYLAQLDGTDHLGEWRVIPCENPATLCLMVQVCRANERDAVVLVDGDKGGYDYLKKLDAGGGGDIPIHSLSEFVQKPEDGQVVAIEDFLSRGQYLTAVNSTYSESVPGYVDVPLAEIESLTRETAVTAHLEDIFATRNLPTGAPRPHFRKADVAIHIASARMQLDRNQFLGDLADIWNRLGKHTGAIHLCTIRNEPATELGDPWCGVFSLVVSKRIGVRQLAITAGPFNDPPGWRFAPEQTPIFMVGGAGVVRVAGSQELGESKYLTFKVIFADNTEEEHTVEFRRLIYVDEIVDGIVTDVVHNGFYMALPGYSDKGWVYERKIPGMRVTQVRGQRVKGRAEPRTHKPGFVEFTLHGVEQPSADASTPNGHPQQVANTVVGLGGVHHAAPRVMIFDCWERKWVKAQSRS